MSTIENLKASEALSGFIQIWKTDPVSGESSLLVHKKNMILKGGAKLIAQTLGGKPDAKIWGMYIGYNNTADFIPKTIDVDYSARFSDYVAPFGYLREPLTFSPSYLSSEDYDQNIVLFSTMVTSATKEGGADFSTDSRIYEVALIAAGDGNNSSQDVVFSRTNFNAIQYNPTYNFTITWGIRVLLP